MKQILYVFIAILCMSSTAIAKDKEKKYSKLAYKDIKKETDDYVIKVNNALSVDGEVKFKFTIQNKTNNFIVYKPAESKISVDGKELPNEVVEKVMIVAPNETKSKVIYSKGDDFIKTKNFTLALNGMYMAVPAEKALTVDNYSIPPDKSEMRSGPFTITFKKTGWDNIHLTTKYDIAYNGSKMGIFYTKRVTLQKPDNGSEVQTKPDDDVFMMRGDKQEVVMKYNANHVPSAGNGSATKWNDAFVEATPEKLTLPALEFAIDEENSK